MMNVLWIGKTGKANAWYHITLTAAPKTVKKVYVVRHEKPVRVVESNKVEYHLFSTSRLIPDIVKMFFRGLWVIRNHNVDLIITYNVYPYGMMAYILSILTGRKLALCFIGADYHTYLMQHPSRFLIQRALGRSSIIICKGHHMTGEILKAGADKEKLCNYPHFVSDEILYQNGEVSKEYDIINISDFIPRKNIDVIVDAVGILKEEGLSLTACLIGDGPLLDPIKKKIESSGLSGQITLTGYQTDIISFLQKSRIYVQTSRDEGLSLALLEALALSLVPVVTEAGAERDIIEDNVSGLFIKTGDPEDLASKLAKLMTAGEYERIKTNVTAIRPSLSLFVARKKMTDIMQKVSNHE